METGVGSALSEVTVLFTIVLAFALLVERLLEVLKTAYDLLDSRYDWQRFWTRQAERTRDFLEQRLRLSQHLSPQAQAAVLARFSEMLLDRGPANPAAIPVLSGDLVRAAGVRLASKLVAVAAGVALALGFGVDLLALSGLVPEGAADASGSTLGRVVTGIAIGLGSGPMHKIITTLESRRRRRSASARARAGEEGAANA